MESLDASPFSSLIGPIDVTWTPLPVFETTVRRDCANSMGRAHGGFLSALVDIATGRGVKRILDDGRSLVTVSTNIEYFAPARVGDRLLAEVRVEHNAAAMVFASCRISTEGRLITSASVVFSARTRGGERTSTGPA